MKQSCWRKLLGICAELNKHLERKKYRLLAGLGSLIFSFASSISSGRRWTSWIGSWIQLAEFSRIVLLLRSTMVSTTSAIASSPHHQTDPTYKTHISSRSNPQEILSHSTLIRRISLQNIHEFSCSHVSMSVWATAPLGGTKNCPFSL